MKIIVGLGNPGPEYANTRHNVGSLMLESMVHDWHLDKKSNALISREGDILYVRPQTYMNLSGRCVSALVQFYKVDPQNDLLVISDDIDMEFAKIRYRASGSHGGQNGLRDIISMLGTSEFSRIKIGIGRHDHMNVSDWVLSRFSPEEIEILETDTFLSTQKLIHSWQQGSISTLRSTMTSPATRPNNS